MSRYALLALVPLLSVALSADDIEDQVRQGLDAYKGKEYQAAITDLNFAVAQIQQKLNAKNAVLLPEPLSGWDADAVQHDNTTMAMMGGGGTLMTRVYYRGDENIKITITTGALAAATLTLINNPMFIGTSSEMSPYLYKRYKGVKSLSDGDVDISLSVAGQILVQVNGQGLKDEAVLKQYLDAMDFDKMKAFLL